MSPFSISSTTTVRRYRIGGKPNRRDKIVRFPRIAFTIAQKARLATLLLCLSIAGEVCADSSLKRGNFDIDGFKGINFGMSHEAVAALGLQCKDDAFTLADLDSYWCTANTTLFGYTADLSVHFRKNGGVSSILVTAGSQQPIDLTPQFTKALGLPHTAILSNPSGYQFRVDYWLSRSGTSIQIWKEITKDGKPRKETLHGTVMYVEKPHYKDQTQTSIFLRKVEVASHPDKDF